MLDFLLGFTACKIQNYYGFIRISPKFYEIVYINGQSTNTTQFYIYFERQVPKNIKNLFQHFKFRM